MNIFYFYSFISVSNRVKLFPTAVQDMNDAILIVIKDLFLVGVISAGSQENGIDGLTPGLKGMFEPVNLFSFF